MKKATTERSRGVNFVCLLSKTLSKRREDTHDGIPYIQQNVSTMRELRNRTLRCSNCADGSSEWMFAGECGHVTCPKCAGREPMPNGDCSTSISDDHSQASGGPVNECPTCQKFLLFPGELSKLPVTFNAFDIVEKMQQQNKQMPASDDESGSSNSQKSYDSLDSASSRKMPTPPFFADEATLKCTEHPLSQTRLYCRTCQCIFCTKKSCIGRHAGHRTEDVHNVLREMEEYIQRRLRKVTRLREKVVEKTSHFKRKVEGKHSNFENMEYQVRTIAKLYHETIDRAEKYMLQEIRQEKSSFDHSADHMTSVLKDADKTLTALLKIKDIFIGSRSRVRAQNVVEMNTFMQSNEAIIEGLEVPGSSKELDKSFHKGVAFLENTSFLEKRSSLLGKLVTSDERKVYCAGEINCRSASDTKEPNLTALGLLPAGEIVVIDRNNKKVKLFVDIGPENISTKIHTLEWETSGSNECSAFEEPSDIAVLADGNFIITNQGLEKPLHVTRNGDITYYSKLNEIGSAGVLGWTCVAVSSDRACWGCWDRKKKEGVVLIPDEEIEKREKRFSLKCLVSLGERYPSKMAVRVDPYSHRICNMVIALDCWKEGFTNGASSIGASQSSLDNPNDCCVAFIKREGGIKYIQSYGDIVGISYTPGGNIVAADRTNNRVLLLSDRGAFRKYLVEEIDGLLAPVAVSIDDYGHVVVAQEDGMVKIFKLFDSSSI